MRKYANHAHLRVQSHGETRELIVFSEPRPVGGTAAPQDPLRWARDEQGRWYSFSSFDDSRLVESSSGDWFCILA